jgi:hypothetical protein
LKIKLLFLFLLGLFFYNSLALSFAYSSSGSTSFVSSHNAAEGNILLWGVSAHHRQFREGSYALFSGIKKTFEFEIGVSLNKLRESGETIKRVGFKGLDNFKIGNSQTAKEESSAIEIEFAPEMNDKQIWTFSFETEALGIVNRTHIYKGAFFVETTNGIYYWLKTRSGEDFLIGPESQANLNNF